MPVKKKDEHDPFTNPHKSTQKSESFKALPEPAVPMAITPRFTLVQAGKKIFDSEIVELKEFGELKLAKCANEAMFLTTDSKTWRRFIFEIIPINQED